MRAVLNEDLAKLYPSSREHKKCNYKEMPHTQSACGSEEWRDDCGSASSANLENKTTRCRYTYLVYIMVQRLESIQHVTVTRYGRVGSNEEVGVSQCVVVSYNGVWHKQTIEVLGLAVWQDECMAPLHSLFPTDPHPGDERVIRELLQVAQSRIKAEVKSYRGWTAGVTTQFPGVHLCNSTPHPTITAAAWRPVACWGRQMVLKAQQLFFLNDPHNAPRPIQVCISPVK